MIKTETELCEKVVAWLERQHWDVYQEVSFGRRADIVATMGPLVWIIEAKKQLSLSLLDQAIEWTGYAHMISIACLRAKRSPRKIMHYICKSTGIGWISVHNFGDINVYHNPRLIRNSPMVDKIQNRLCKEQKSYAPAGSQGGGYWTPFAGTCREVLSRVREKPGITMKELMDGLKHHYSSDSCARSSLAQWAREGVIKGVRLEHEGRLIKLYPEDKNHE